MGRRTLAASGLAAIATLTATAANAGDYRIVSFDKDLMFAVDLGSISRKGEHLQAAYLTVFKPAERTDGGVYNYTVVVADFECATQTYRHIALAGFSATHREVFSDMGASEWYTAEPASTMSLVFEAVCTPSQLPDDIYDSSMEELAERFLALEEE
jgi:hypothetical protein